ncbi:nuclear transport factor 2 family protein [Ferrovibrio sp. MS7]|uniref:nuclear transport factor 2 family protein n=1 Tax=Ferrovibrio plantarum TaxID=3119164 RepID=UPI003135D93C
MPNPATLEAFIALVESGAHDTAIERFYTEAATMQENLTEPPRRGRANLVAHERAVLARVQSVESECVRPVFVEGDRTVIRWIFRFTFKDGSKRAMDELAYQRWEGEKIAEERFYYDPAQLRG